LSSRIGGIEFAQHVTAIRSSSDILDLVNGNSRHVIAVDEVQLLDSGIINVIKKLSNAQNHIIVAGLDKSFRGDWFPLSDFKCSMADVIELFEPEDRIHLLASCEVCGDNAEFVQRLINGKPAPYFDPLIVIGDKNIGSGTEVRSYEPRCQHHFEVPFAEEWSLTKYLLKNRVPKEEILRIISCADKILERLQAEQSPVDSKLSNN
jgi:thymidine kinase